MPKKRKKMAQISLRIDAHLKEAAETAATEDHRSLTSLVEQLLASHIWRRHVLSMSRRPSKEAARAASQIVSKRIGSPYRAGRSADWIKVKNPAAPAVKREAEEDWK